MIAIGNDIKHAARVLLRSRWFVTAAVFPLSIGIALTCAVFTLLYVVVLRPLPFQDSDALVRLESRLPGLGIKDPWDLSVAGYFFFRGKNRTFEDIGAFTGRDQNITYETDAERGYVANVTGSLLSVIRARPVLGRMLGGSDEMANSPDVAILSYGLWRRRYGGNVNAIGKTIIVQGRPYQLVGVMEAGIDLPEQKVDVWVPWRLDPSAPAQNSHFVSAIGRLSTGVSIDRAREDIRSLTAQLADAFPAAYARRWMSESAFTTGVIPLKTYVIGDAQRRLVIVFGAVSLLLAICVANVISLLVARLEARKSEIALRNILGAQPTEIVRLVSLEPVLITLAATGIGLLLSVLLTRALSVYGPILPRYAEFSPLPFASVAFVGVLVALLTTVFAATVGARTRDAAPGHAIGAASRGTTSMPGRLVVHQVIAAGQMALAFVLIGATVIVLRSFLATTSIKPGFEPRNVLTFKVSLPAVNYRSADDVARYYRLLQQRIEELPGVRFVGMVHRLPVADAAGCFAIYFEGAPVQSSEQPCLSTRFVSAGFFRSLGIPLASGREFTAKETSDGSGAVIVSQSTARRLWAGDRTAVGRGLQLFGPGPPYYRVVGVASEVRDALERPPSEAVYFPLRSMQGQAGWGTDAIRTMSVIVRLSEEGHDRTLLFIRQLAAEIDRTVPLDRVMTMSDVISKATARLRFTLLLMVVASVFALILALVGIYALFAYIVRQRRLEIAIRMAVGAEARNILAMVVRRTLLLALSGVVIGFLISLASSRVLNGVLYEVKPNDPLTLISVGAGLVVVAVLASVIPAVRAAGLQPVRVLRGE